MDKKAVSLLKPYTITLLDSTGNRPVAGIAQSVYRLAACCCTVWESNSGWVGGGGGAGFFPIAQTGPEVHPASCIMGTGSFPGVRRPGLGVDFLSPSCILFEKMLEIYIRIPYVPS